VTLCFGDRRVYPSVADHPASHRGAKSLSSHGYTPEQLERLSRIHSRLIEARRELDALIGDAYLRPRASIVPVHFLDLASAVEKLRWAEKEWRELDREVTQRSETEAADEDDDDAGSPSPEGQLVEARRG